MKLLFLEILILILLIAVARILRVHASKNVSRDNLSRLLKTLIRLHENDARLEFVHMTSPVQLDVILANGDGAKCELLIKPARTVESDGLALDSAVVDEQVSLIDPARPSLGLRVLIPSIWASATETASQVMHRVCDTLHLGAFARFKIEFSGKKSLQLVRCDKGSNVVVLDPDVAKVFKDSRSVNRVLREAAESRGRGRVSR